MRRRSTMNGVFAPIRTASARPCFIAEKAAASSRGSWTSTTCTPVPRVRATRSATLADSIEPRLSGRRRTVTWEARGISCFSSSRRFAARPLFSEVTPVTFPPGRARLSMSPSATGSAPVAMTFGIDAVAQDVHAGWIRRPQSDTRTGRVHDPGVTCRGSWLGARLGPHHADERHALARRAAQIVGEGELSSARDTRDLPLARLAPELEPALEEHAQTGSPDRMAE